MKDVFSIGFVPVKITFAGVFPTTLHTASELLPIAYMPPFEVFRREKQGFWSLYTLGPGDTIELSSLGLRFPVADVYQDTSFLEEANE